MYSQGSVLVLPSIEEGLALVQAQAMACGLPVIATTNTGAENLFSDSVEGFIVPIRNPVAIRDKVEWMIGHPIERTDMGAAALQRVAGGTATASSILPCTAKSWLANAGRHERDIDAEY